MRVPSLVAALSTPVSLEDLGAGRAVVLEGMLGPTAVVRARAAAIALDAAGGLRASGVGRTGAAMSSVRGDRIAWLDPGTAAGALGPVIDLLQATMVALHELVHLGADELECQLAVYDKGAGYERHRDTVRGTSSRRVTAIYYLGDWRPGDGGELELFGSDGDPDRVVEPTADRLVLFRSELTEHAVRPVVRGPRLAISAFFRRRAVA